MELFGAELEHLHQAGLVEHRVGVGRADQARHATGHGRGHLGFEHALMLVPRLAQARRQIDEARQHQTARGIDDTRRLEPLGHAADADDAPGGQRNAAHRVQARGRIQHPAGVYAKFRDFKQKRAETLSQKAHTAINSVNFMHCFRPRWP